MKRLTLLSAMLVTILTMAAQYRVTATVIDPDGEPEGYCTWYIFAATDSIKPLQGAVSDEMGTINATLPAPGTYTLSITAPMRNTVNADFTVSQGQPVANLGILSTTTMGQQLQGVTVTAQRPLVTKEIDRLGYDVSADQEAKTSTLQQILRKVPMVTVEPDGTIKVNGSDNYKVYKNGRPNNAFTKNAKDIFAAIPASTIKKIEVITDPGSREDAEGSAVILNIVTDRETHMAGVTGNINVNYNSAQDAPNPSAYIMTQYRKLTMSANGGYFQQGSHMRQRNVSHTRYEATGDAMYDSLHVKTSGHGSYFGVEGSLDLDTLNLMTVALNGFTGSFGYDGNGLTRMTAAGGTPLWEYTSAYNYPKNGYTDIDFSFDYQRSTRLKGETITASYRLSHTDQTQDQETRYTILQGNPMDYNGIRSDFDMKFMEHTAQLDWSRPLGGRSVLDTGVKYIRRTSHSNNHRTMIGQDNPPIANEFEHKYDIMGVYADFRHTLGKVSLRGGLRYEYSRLGAEFIAGPGDAFHANLNDFAPNASVAWTIGQASMLKASYSRRIERPGISYLNPAVTVSPTSQSYGNPDLESAGANEVVVNYSVYKQKFSADISATLNVSNNGLGGISWTDADNIRYATYGNVLHKRRAGVNGYFNWTLGSKTSWMANFNLTWTKFSNPTLDLSLSRAGGYFYTSVTQKLPWKITGVVDLSYWAGYIESVYSYGTCSFPRTLRHNLTLRRSFLKDESLSLSVGVSNPFANTRPMDIHTLNNGQTLHQYNLTTGMRGVTVGVSWRFGKLRAQVKKTAATIKNDDLTGRKN